MIFFHMRRSIFLLICCLLFGLTTQVQGQKKISSKQAPAIAVDAAQLDKHASELMATYLSPAKVAGEVSISKLNDFNELVSMESLLFPADELYQSNWDTVNVNPFQRLSITFPDTYTIDCRTYISPVDNEVKITSKYGPRRRRMHSGTDLKVIVGDTIRAAFDGKIRIKSFERKGYGYYLVIRHPNGLETVYGHLSKFLVNENQIVRSGEPIGLGGNTGRSTGSHLHFETRFLGKAINPEEIIDFVNGVPHKDEYVFHNIKVNGKSTNIYSTSADAVAIHRVRKGETLGHIAVKYGTTVNELCNLNGITRTSTLQIGQAIRFRAKQENTSAPAKKETTETNQSQQTSTTAQTAAIKYVVAEKTGGSDDPIYHRIEAGDTLYSVAKKYGTTIDNLCNLNQIKENLILKIGQKIRCS